MRHKFCHQCFKALPIFLDVSENPFRMICALSKACKIPASYPPSFILPDSKPYQMLNSLSKSARGKRNVRIDPFSSTGRHYLLPAVRQKTSPIIYNRISFAQVTTANDYPNDQEYEQDYPKVPSQEYPAVPNKPHYATSDLPPPKTPPQSSKANNSSNDYNQQPIAA